MLFLTYLFHDKEQKYDFSIAAARSALVAILPTKDGKIFGKDQYVSRLVKGIFKLRPSLPKYVATYDSEIILSFINQLLTNK